MYNGLQLPKGSGTFNHKYKLNRLLNQAALNENMTRNSVGFLSCQNNRLNIFTQLLHPVNTLNRIISLLINRAKIFTLKCFHLVV